MRYLNHSDSKGPLDVTTVNTTGSFERLKRSNRPIRCSRLPECIGRSVRITRSENWRLTPSSTVASHTRKAFPGWDRKDSIRAWVLSTSGRTVRRTTLLDPHLAPKASPSASANVVLVLKKTLGLLCCPPLGERSRSQKSMIAAIRVVSILPVRTASSHFETNDSSR